jgi:mannosyltransferase
MTTNLRHFLRLYWLPGLILLAAFGLRIYRLDAQSLWYDEGYSLHLARMPLAESTRWTARDLVPPLYYYLLHYWILATGASEFAARMFSVCAGILALPLGYCIGRRLFGRLAGLLVMLFFALSPLYVWHAQDARMYMLLTSVDVVAIYALTMILTTETCQASQGLIGLRWWWLWGLALVALIYTHTIGVFLAAGQVLIVTFAWRRERRRGGRRRQIWLLGLAVGLALTVAYAPWLWLVRRQYEVNAGYFPGTLPPLTVISTALKTFATGDAYAEPAASYLAAAILLLLAMAALTLAVRRETQTKLMLSMPARSLFLLLLLLLPLLMMAAAFYHIPKFAPRYTAAASPAFFILLAGGMAIWLRSHRWAQVLAVVGLTTVLVIFTSGVGLIYTDSRLAKEDFRGAARFVQRNIASDETVLLLSGHFFPVWTYYYPGSWTPLPDIPILDLNRTLNYSVADTLNQALADKRGAWVIRWQDQVIDPNGFVAMLLDQAGRQEPTEVAFEGVKVSHYRWDTPPHFSAQPDIAQPVNTRCGPIELLGYTQITDTIKTFWQANAKTNQDYRVALRLLDEQGNPWGRWDQRPTTFLYPTSYWKPGEALFGHYPIPAIPGTPPGRYRLDLSVYDEQSGQPCNCTDAAGQSLGVWQTLPVTLTHTWGKGDVPRDLAHPLAYNLNDDIQLLGYGLDANDVTIGSPVHVELYWQARRAPVADYSVRIEWAGTDSTASLSVTRPMATQHSTREWTAGEFVRSQFALRAPPTAGTFMLQLQLLDESGLSASAPLPLASITVPPAQRPSGVIFGNRITLIGADLSTPRARPGQSVRLTLYWRAEAKLERSLTVFTHLLTADDHLVAQHDGLPVNDTRPTTTWLPSEIIRDVHEWNIPPNAPPGTYRIKIGLYDHNQPEMPRLPVLDSSGQVIADSALLGTLEVTP